MDINNVRTKRTEEFANNRLLAIDGYQATSSGATVGTPATSNGLDAQ
jgi:hypothetical protein